MLIFCQYSGRLEKTHWFNNGDKNFWRISEVGEEKEDFFFQNVAKLYYQVYQNSTTSSSVMITWFDIKNQVIFSSVGNFVLKRILNHNSPLSTKTILNTIIFNHPIWTYPVQR